MSPRFVQSQRVLSDTPRAAAASRGRRARRGPRNSAPGPGLALPTVHPLCPLLIGAQNVQTEAKPPEMPPRQGRPDLVSGADGNNEGGRPVRAVVTMRDVGVDAGSAHG